MSISKALDYPKIPCVYLNILIKTVEEWHISPEQLLLGCGLSLESLNSSDFRVDYPIFAKLLFRAVLLTKEPGLGFFIGRQMKISSHGLVGFAVMVASNIRDALNIIENYAKIQVPRLNLKLTVEEKNACFSWDPDWLNLKNDNDRQAYEIIAIFSCLAAIEAIPILCGQKVGPIRIDFIFKRPAYFDQFESLINQIMGEVHCDQPYTRIVLPTSALELPLLLADSVTAKLMIEQCQRELDKLLAESSIVRHVRVHIYNDKEGIRSIEDVAKQLKLSKRTLQRLLKNSDQSFNAIYDDVREQKALLLVKRKDLSLDQISEKLGYANSASFNRAFKRWTGQTPGKYMEESVR
ncbi:AraC family transcriptional regulator ligand-binding domain-containing protein [Aquirhabdus sp.]|uniref:AraC family transcriptional regulator n=1 Tax=Aquirhabdus sp. TaxID=2824160 RepID=UPI00396C3810